MDYEYPESFARFYDLIYNHQRGGIDKEYFLNEIRQSGGRILDIGVGTGRIFTDALKEGADIYGIDISQSMIDILTRKINGEYLQRISRQNFIDFKFDFKFDLIIAPFHVFMHLLEKDEQIKAINNVCDHLNNNGKFIFDVFVPDLRQLINKIDNHTDFVGEYDSGKKIKRIVSTNPDLINQIIHIKFRLEWDEDNDIKREVWNVPLRFFFRYELEHLIDRSRFEKYRIIGDYKGNKLSLKSETFIMVCQK